MCSQACLVELEKAPSSLEILKSVFFRNLFPERKAWTRMHRAIAQSVMTKWFVTCIISTRVEEVALEPSCPVLVCEWC